MNNGGTIPPQELYRGNGAARNGCAPNLPSFIGMAKGRGGTELNQILLSEMLHLSACNYRPLRRRRIPQVADNKMNIVAAHGSGTSVPSGAAPIPY